jgi:hypothetical protein
MVDFMTRPSTALISRRERYGALCALIVLIAAWPTSGISWLSNTLTGVGIAGMAVVIGRIATGWRNRSSFGKKGLDRGVTVYGSRSHYTEILANITSANEVDVVGMSLAYALDHIRDNSRDFFRRVEKVRVLLPGSESLCNERDRAQDGAPGSLWQAVQDSLASVRRLQAEYPNSISVRFFTMQPYGAMTRVDDTVWVAPYITRSGGSSPVMIIGRPRSEHLFELYTGHFDRIWNDPDTKAQPDEPRQEPPRLAA